MRRKIISQYVDVVLVPGPRRYGDNGERAYSRFNVWSRLQGPGPAKKRYRNTKE
jgi:hypothetical protein